MPDPRLFNTKSAVAYLGGASSILARAKAADWIAPVLCVERGNALFDRTDLDTVIDRLKRGEILPQLPSQMRQKELRHLNKLQSKFKDVG